MDIQKIELTTEETSQMNAAFGYTPEETSIEESVFVAEDVPEVLTNEQPEGTEQVEVAKQVVEAAVETQEDPQLVIQEPEKETAVPTKVKTRAFKDSFQASLNKYYNNTEKPDVVAFTQAYYANYDNLTPVEIIRQDIVNDPLNKGLRASLIDKLLNDRLSKFEYLSDDDEEIEFKDHLLKREAEIVKGRMVQYGKDFVAQFQSDDLEIELDAPVSQKEQEPTPEELQVEREALVAKYSPEVSKFVRNGVIQVQDKDGIVNIPAVSNEDYVEAFINPIGFLQSIALNSDGTPNMGKWIQFVTAAKNLSIYNSTMIKHGIALGQSKLASKIKNEAPLAQARPVDAEPEFKTIQQDPLGFGKAMANMKPWRGN